MDNTSESVVEGYLLLAAGEIVDPWIDPAVHDEDDDDIGDSVAPSRSDRS